MSTAARLARSLRNQIALKKAAVPSSASIGVAWCDAQSTTAEALVAQADTAMHQSKRAGNGEPVLFDESMPGAEGPRDMAVARPSRRAGLTPPPELSLISCDGTLLVGHEMTDQAQRPSPEAQTPAARMTRITSISSASNCTP